MIDNSTHVIAFVPAIDDGDTFIYTEMLDRGKKKGNNGQRLLKTFYHRSAEEFQEQLPTIKKLCDMGGVRACTRIAPRSYKSVGRVFTEMVVNAALTDNWAGMKTLYSRACGIVSPIKKLWLFDVDKISAESDAFAKWLKQHAQPRGCGGPPLLVARIPSKKGEHLISLPFELVRYTSEAGVDLAQIEISLHKDNPTNLYIPDGAD